jgi:hypothetical protein
MLTVAPVAFANFITDWDEIAVKTIRAPGPSSPVPAAAASAAANVLMQVVPSSTLKATLTNIWRKSPMVLGKTVALS